MRLSSSFFVLVALATLGLASPHPNYHDVINDIDALRESAVKLEEHVKRFDIMNMLQDKKAIIDGLDHISRDAMSAKTFTSVEATEVLSAANRLAQEIHQLSDVVIRHKNEIPSALHSTIANDLQAITLHAKGAGESLINDCPVDKRQEADKIYGQIADALHNAEKAFSS